MKADIIEETIEVPEGIKVSKENLLLTIEGPKGKVQRKLNPKMGFELKDNTIRLFAQKATKREKTIIGTFTAHIQNMIEGAKEGFTYRMKICSGHFPMTVQVKGSDFIVKNFIGEKMPRVMKLKPGVDVKVEGDAVVLTSADKELAGQTAASIEVLTSRAKYDKRIFQDGIYITDKPGREIR
jgi:large subunit ribosomal protein L6